MLAISRQALAFALEAEGPVILPGLKHLRMHNCRGSTQDPRTRDDFHLIE